MYFKDVVYKNFVILSKSYELPNVLQSTPVISRQLGAKIRERELSGSHVFSRRPKLGTSRIRVLHCDVCTS